MFNELIKLKEKYKETNKKKIPAGGTSKKVDSNLKENSDNDKIRE